MQFPSKKILCIAYYILYYTVYCFVFCIALLCIALYIDSIHIYIGQIDQIDR